MQSEKIFYRQIASVLTGTIVAQAIPVLGSLVIARLYIPDEFGTFSAWLAVVSIVSTILTCRYEAAFVLVEDGYPRRVALTAVLVVATLCTLAFAFLVYIAYTINISWIRSLDLKEIILLVLSSLCVAMNCAWQAWMSTEGRFRRLSETRIVQAASVTSIQIIFGFVYANAFGLILGYFLGNVISIIFVHLVIRDDTKKITTSFVKDGINFLRKYRNFPFIALPAGCINVVSAQLPLILVASLFGTDKAGYLALSMKVLGAPIGLLGKSVLDVFKRYALISYRDTGTCKKEYIKTFRLLVISSLFFTVCMFLFGEELFVLVYGEGWRMAGIMSIWLLPLYTMRFIASPLSYTVFLAEKQHIDLIWQIILLISTVITLGIIVPVKKAIIIYSVIYSFLYCIYLVMSYKFSLPPRKG